MNLHTDPELFQDAVVATAQRLQIPEIYIEKDYWVTVALHKIFHSEIAPDAVFKGGTALSKCFGIIERFSEDVDIVVLNRKDESANQLKNKLKAITDSVAQILPEVAIEGITNKRGMIRKTAHMYQRRNFIGVFGQIREQIIVEATWLGSSEPYTTAMVTSYITEMMAAGRQDGIIERHNMQPFAVKVLTKERTLCEKIMSLVRFSQTPEPYVDLANKIRHVYDIHLLLKDESTASFFNSPAFDKLLLRVGHDDVVSFKNNNNWLINHPAQAIIFRSPDDSWNRIKSAYSTTFKEFVLGKLPTEADLVDTLKNIYKRLEQVKWHIQTK